MGIYLPNMEMPKDGEWISLNISPGGKCFIQSWCGKEFNFAEKVTAVPVPEHVDLIDRNALLADTTDMLHSMMVFGGARVYTSDAIKNATTIIPASGGKEDE